MIETPDVSVHAPLRTRERWIYGGVGAMAPLAVAAATQDLGAVFSNTTTITMIGWSARVVLLFIIGGFVAFLHKKENDAWRCFLIGLAAPALITTGLAGSANRRVSAMPGLLTSAYAQATSSTATAPSSIKTIPLQSFGESFADQIARGFFGKNPQQTMIIVTSEPNAAVAQKVAASVADFAKCAVKKDKQLDAPGIAEPFIIADNKQNRYLVAVQTGNPDAGIAFFRTLNQHFPVQDMIVSKQSSKAEDLSKRLKDYASTGEQIVSILAPFKNSCPL